MILSPRRSRWVNDFVNFFLYSREARALVLDLSTPFIASPLESACMRALREETRLLIESLYKPLPFWRSSTQHQLAALALIRQTDDPAAIPELVHVLFTQNRELSRATAETIAVLGKRLGPSDLPWLDHLMRERSPFHWTYPSAWADLTPEKLRSIDFSTEASVFSLGLASFHLSGYVREEALNQLGQIHNGAELPFLLLRLNDWVAPVRDKALDLVYPRFSAPYAAAFAENLAILDKLRFARRATLSHIVHAVEDLLRKNQSALFLGLKSEDRHLRRLSYKLVLQDGVHDAVLMESALSEPDPIIRLFAVDQIVFSDDLNHVQQILTRARNDPFGPIRMRILRTAFERLPEIVSDWLKTALLDPHAPTREFAQARLREAGIDLRTFYVQAIAESEFSRLGAAIAGLGEVGSSKDAPTLLVFASHRSARIRRVAVRALSRLAAEASLPTFLALIGDSSPRVSREAVNTLKRFRSLINAGHVWTLFEGSQYIHVRRNALSLLVVLSKWDAITYLLLAVATQESVRIFAIANVQLWLANFNKSFIAPSLEQTARVSDALAQAQPYLERPVLGKLRFLLK